jgi:pilus assembly protein CpaB
MSTARIAVLGLAIGSAVVAAFLAKGFIGQKPETQIVEVSKVQTSEILVASKDIAMGERLKSANLAWESWPADAIRPYMITRTAQPDARETYDAARARTALFEGEVISDKKVVKPDSAGFMAAILPKGMRAISVRISAETGVGGFILPNDKVDVILTVKESTEGSSKARTTSDSVLQNVRVLAVDQTFQTNDKGEQVVVGKTATLELEPHQAEILAMAESVGQLSLALRSLADNGDSALGDDGPVLSDRYTKGGQSGTVTIFRYGVGQTVAISE